MMNNTQGEEEVRETRGRLASTQPLVSVSPRHLCVPTSALCQFPAQASSPQLECASRKSLLKHRSLAPPRVSDTACLE